MSATKKRLAQLLAKELDGELTALEREELDRLVLLEPDVRRERAAWAAAVRVMRDAGPSVPRIDAAQMSRRVLHRRAAPRSPRTFGSWLMLSSAIAVVTVALWAVAHRPEPRPEVPRQVHASKPVEIWLGEPSRPDDGPPVTIRF